MEEEESIPGRVAIGISFGNSYSSIAFTSSEGRAEVIANQDGDRQIPTVLSYIEGEEFGGAQAKAQLIRNPKNTVAYFRDLLGQNFESIDPSPCHASAHPVNHHGGVSFSVRDSEEEKENVVSVSDIVTRHMKRLKESASDFLGKQVDSAVITIPTNFSDTQKEALQRAVKASGLEVLQFISEPSAAALAYDARREANLEDKIVVVADLGGTRSDVAVISSRGGMYSLLATAHDYELGGAYLDQVLIDYFAKEFMKKHKIDPRQNTRSLAKLKQESEKTKKALSIGTSATFGVESLESGIDFSASVNRTRYELLADKIFASFTRLIVGAVQKAELDVIDIDEVVLSGGTSHTPKIARNLQGHFPESTTILAPSTSPSAINPSELAARGAAIQASLVQEYDLEDIEQSSHPMVTVTPHLQHAIGILCANAEESTDLFIPLIAPETAVPVRRTAYVAVPKDGGDVLVRLGEGQREIKVTKTQPKKPEMNGMAKGGEGEEEKDEDDDLDDSEDEEEEIREKIWRPVRLLAEAAVKGTKKGAKVEVQVVVGADLELQMIVREVGEKSGVRGTVERPAVAENGSA